MLTYNPHDLDDLDLTMDVTRHIEDLEDDPERLEMKLCGRICVPVEAFLDVTPDDTFFKITLQYVNLEKITLECSREYLEKLDQRLINTINRLKIL